MPDLVWYTADKRRIAVTDMDDQHISNCIARILRRHTWRRQYLHRLMGEQIARDVRRRSLAQAHCFAPEEG